MLWIFIALIVVVIAILLYIFPIIEVCGESMNPTFNDGDIILGCRLYSLNVNSVYVFHPPVGEKYVIKRLTQVSSTTNKLFFEGDNSDCSYDSRMYGYISRDKVVAKYIFTIYRRKECNDNGYN